jgi:predicted transcriptional regulator
MVQKVTPENREFAKMLFEDEGLSRGEIASILECSEPTAWFLTSDKTQGFKSYRAYIESNIKKRGARNLEEYRESIALEKGFNSVEEYLLELRRKREENKEIRGIPKYRELLREKRARQEKNINFSRFLKSRLEFMGKNQSWLARELNVSRETVSAYVHGEIMPSKERLYTLCDVLGVYFKE